MLREIRLPSGVTGRLFRSPMPGRYDWDFRKAEQEISSEQIDLVVSLATMREIRTAARQYARLIEDEDLVWEMWDMPVSDGGVPEDEDDFLDLARDLAEELRGGMHALIHCYEGIGRTGTLATLTLVALGMPLGEARRAVEESGAGPETYQQEQLVDRLGRVLRRDEER